MPNFTLLIKPAGPDCNLACKYCFYTGKSSLFTPGRHRMSDEVLHTLLRDYLSLGFTENVFAWQGGEPTLMGLDFYQKVVELQQRYGRPGQAVSNSLQTNAVLLDEAWCDFLHRYNFLLGISLDGPQELHDYYRCDHTGRGSFNRIMQSIDLCRAHKVDFNILVLLNDRNVTQPNELFDFFTAHDFRFLQFIPCIEKDPATGRIADFSLTPEQYGNFLCTIFDRWLDHGPEKLSIRLFDSVINYLVTGKHTDCTFSRKCDDYIVVEHNGDVFCCDFFVDPAWQLGNILQTPINELFHSSLKTDFARRKRNVANKCFVCRYYQLCHGGCLKHRTVINSDFQQPSLLCPAYQQFFDHALDSLMNLSAQVRTKLHQS